MSKIRPFRGIRPRPDMAQQIAAPPYDVVDFDEARAYVKKRPNSFLRVEKSEIDLDRGLDMHDKAIFERGAANLRRLRSGGLMIQDPVPCFYLYRQKMGEHVQTGLVAGASVSEYQKGLIKKHEFTRPDKEKERTLHVEIIGANTGPVFLTYPADRKIDAYIGKLCARKPDVDFVSEDGIGHTLWVVADRDEVEALRSLFAEVPALYVADGHHRSAAASNVQERRRTAGSAHDDDAPHNYFLTVIFPHDQMKIMEYNRVVRDLNGHNADRFKELVATRFEIEETETASPPKPTQFGMFLEGKWHRLRARAGTFDPVHPVDSLDAAILQNNLLAPILGIKDPRTDKRIQFIGGIRGTTELESRAIRSGGVAFAMHATRIEQLMAIADAGKVMPPKSTWFEPKLRSGMVVHSIDEA